MNHAPADSAPELPREGWPAEPKLPREGWSPAKFIFLVSLALAAHLALIFIFGNKKPVVPRRVANVPQFQLAENSSELIALDDPTLFALPHANDYATAFWQRPPVVTTPDFRWTEPARYLPLVAKNLGAAFGQFMQTNPPVTFALNFKPSPPFGEFLTPAISAPPPMSTLQIIGDLTRRRLLNPIHLPLLTHNDVLPPGKVQAFVDAAGNVISVTLLEPSGLELADTNAISIARSLRFAPAAQMTLGEMIFNWHTLPAPATNATINP